MKSHAKRLALIAIAKLVAIMAGLMTIALLVCGIYADVVDMLNYSIASTVTACVTGMALQVTDSLGANRSWNL
jgi:hypothetical protein